MATMLKEKRREKKRSKGNSLNINNSKTEVLVAINKQECLTENEISVQKSEKEVNKQKTEVSLPENEVETVIKPTSEDICTSSHSESNSLLSSQHTIVLQNPCIVETHSNIQFTNSRNIKSVSYLECINSLGKVTLNEKVSVEKEAVEAGTSNSLLGSFSQSLDEMKNVVASAPILENAETLVPLVYQEEIPVMNEVVKLSSMSIDDAIKTFGGIEISEMMIMSDKEEAIVEMGPMSVPENILIDLLTTFRRSIIATERESAKLQTGCNEEETYRAALWKMEKKYIMETQKCPCGLSVNFRFKYDFAELQKDKICVAQMKLEFLLRELQESFCHHQHEAVLAFYQIEHLLSEIMKSNKVNIREALTLVLQALKLCDNCNDMCSEVLAATLEKWAGALAASLMDQRDLRQLLFLIHHLFRQNRSIKWAASVVSINITDNASAARALALMELLFAKTRLDAAIECVEADNEEVWEEVDKDDDGGAVSDCTLRERDLLALLRGFPMRDLVASIVSFPLLDIGQTCEYVWCEDVLSVIRACCGVRVLARVVGRACQLHAHYKRLQYELRGVLLAALRALAGMHHSHRASYSNEMELQVLGELQAAFTSGAEVMDADQLLEVPAGLLSAAAAREYCLAHVLAVNNHDESSSHIDALNLDVPPLSCAGRVRIVTRAAADRFDDYDLAKFTLEFLFQVGIRQNNTAACKGECRQVACEAIAGLLAKHTFLYSMTLQLIAESSQVEKIQASALDWLSLDKWRPDPAEIRAVLEDWWRRCPHLVSPLLLRVDCRPHAGISLESQLTIGSWVCEQSGGTDGGEWKWAVLRRLRTHRSCWTHAEHYDASPPETQPTDLISKAYALLATSWGHCIPLICSEGVEALCELAASRVSDALHCFAGLAVALAASPESVAVTPRFGDFFALVLSAGPSLVQRALGRGGASGADLLLWLLLKQLPLSYAGVSSNSLTDVWACALWRDNSGAASVLDVALMMEDRQALARRARSLASAADEASQHHITVAATWASEAPLVAAHALWALHTYREVRSLILGHVLEAVHTQRMNQQRIHVDNALKALGLTMTAEDLVIHRAASAALVAPSHHPAHLMLWHLFMHIYLQPPPSDNSTTTSPVGPLFFSGLIKSRTLGQLKRHLREVIKYHGDEANKIKTKQQQPTTSTEPRTSRAQAKPISTDDVLTVPLSAKDFQDGSSDTSDTESYDSKAGMNLKDVVISEEKKNVICADNLLAYHVGAERMLCKYVHWLEEGDGIRAQSHNADISVFIPEKALEAAYQEEFVRRVSMLPLGLEPLPLPPACLPTPLPPKKTPFEEVKDVLMKIEQRTRKRSQRCKVKSVVEDVNFKDARGLLNLVEKYLRDVEQFSQEWCKETVALSALDSALWDLVRRLRVPRALPLMRASCANKCAPLTYEPGGREWCISTGTEQAIKENRSSARAAMRRLSRPRPSVARAAAALLIITRGASSAELGRRMAESAWRSAGRISERCKPAASTVAAVVELLADRWLCWDGKTCVELFSHWAARGVSALQEEAATSLLAPRRVPPQMLPLLHEAVLKALPSTRASFCRLSKFEMGKWAKEVDGAVRRDMALALVAATRRWGATPGEDEHQIVELLGVQIRAVCAGEELVPLIRAATQACRSKLLPPSVLRNICLVAADKASELPFDQLGHLLRELGTSWWEARTQPRHRGVQYDEYAPYFANLLTILQLAFVGAALRISYTPDKAGAMSWGSALESWSPWLTPHESPPLVYVGSSEAIEKAVDVYGELAGMFFSLLARIMDTYPGCEEKLLSCTWDWVVHSRAGAGALAMRGALLRRARAAPLPWDSVQWLAASTPHVLVKVAEGGDSELCEWSAECIRAQQAATWLRGSDDHVAARLALLLYLWTASPLGVHQQTLDEACLLPWHRLPEVALEDVLQRFFCGHHSLATPYHRLPQFRVILFASELCWADGAGPNQRLSARQKRLSLVAGWVRAAASPPLLPHAAAASAALLSLLVAAGHHLEPSSGELEELLERALLIMCIEPAASVAVAEWKKAVSAGSVRWSRACIRATCSLTAYEPFAALADSALTAYMQTEGASWSEVVSLWQRCVWSDPTGLCARAKLYAAYAVCAYNNAHSTTDCAALRNALVALLASDINFTQNEAIVSTWICLACRVSVGLEGDEECAVAAKTLLCRWSRRTLLSLLSAQDGTPTANHRVLCLLAQCTFNPSDEGVARAYEAAVPAAAEAGGWARPPPCPRRLPRLAARLLPHAVHYFDLELKLTPESDKTKE